MPEFECTIYEEAGYRIARRMLVEFTEAFRLLARTPDNGHKRENLAEDSSLLFWPTRDYLIVYKPGTDPLQIVLIARGRQDVPGIIVRRGL